MRMIKNKGSGREYILVGKHYDTCNDRFVTYAQHTVTITKTDKLQSKCVGDGITIEGDMHIIVVNHPLWLKAVRVIEINNLNEWDVVEDRL